ncbi:MAG: nucleotide exchange factor GrpE [Bacilli bacterium]
MVNLRSEEIKKETEENVKEDEKKEKKVPLAKLEKVQEELRGVEADRDSWKNKYYSVYADMENLRKVIEKDHREAMKYRSEGFVINLIPSLDSFHMATQIEGKTEEMKAFITGFRYIYNNIISAIAEEGVTEITPKIGDKFDEKTMHALDTVEQEGDENIIVNVAGSCYKIYDRIIRPAMVYVSKKPAVKDEKIDKDAVIEENID